MLTVSYTDSLLLSKIDNRIRTKVVSNSDDASSKAVVLMLINCLFLPLFVFSWSLFGFFAVRF